MAAGKGNMERIRRAFRTIFFMLTMVFSLIMLSALVLVTVGDVLVLCVLVSSFTCVRCRNFKGHLARYNFRSSFMDVPMVSIARLLVITCFGIGCGFGIGWGFGGMPLNTLGLGAGGGCGIGFGLGWGFGTAFGSHYRTSEVKFQGVDFSHSQSNGKTTPDLSRDTQIVESS